MDEDGEEGPEVRDKRRFDEDGNPREPEETTRAESPNAQEDKKAEGIKEDVRPQYRSEDESRGKKKDEKTTETSAKSEGAPSKTEGAPPKTEGAPSKTEGAPPIPEGATPIPEGATPIPEGATPIPEGATPIPEASFTNFLMGLATTALVELGAVTHPASGEKRSNIKEAKYIIDTIGILEEKTRGNLTPEEETQLRQVLYNLRMTYIEKQKEAEEAGGGG